MRRTPHPYQTLARSFFTELPRAALWAKPGMGKTGSTLLAISDLMLCDDVQRTLIIAPKRVAESVWGDEAPRWPGVAKVIGPIVPIVGTAEQRKRALRVPAKMHTVNFENLPWLVDRLDGDWPFDCVVVDEASKLRGFRSRQGTKRARALARFAHTPAVRHFYELTGTPAANHLHALWGQMWFIDKGARLGSSFEAFKGRWFQSVGIPGQEKLTPLPFAYDQIMALLSDITLPLNPRDWFNLIEPVYTRVPVKLPAKAAAIYKSFQRDLYAALAWGGEVAAFSAAAKSIKCLQLANGAAYTNPEATEWEEVHTAKLEALEEIVEETTDSAVICVYQFVPDKLRILKAFPGSVDLSTKQGMAAFKAGDSQLGVAHPASVGHGIDGLQDVCNAIVFFGHWWDAEEREQIIDRVGPMRQHHAKTGRPLFLYDLVAEDTIDLQVMARHETKREIYELLMEARRA